MAEDHQTKNAHTLSDYNAAVLIKDNEAEEQLASAAIELLKNQERLRGLSEQSALFAQPNSTGRIVDEVVKLMNKS